MRTKRNELSDDVIRYARAFRDACGDGLGLAANTDAYQAWLWLSEALDAFDGLEPGSIEVTRHVANVDGPDTQHEAANLAKVRAKSLRSKLLAQYRIRASLDDGLTDSEMEFMLRRSHQSVSSARNFLASAGWIYDTGRRRLNPSGGQAIVWAMTPAGIRAWAA